jgi:hypothetical protein
MGRRLAVSIAALVALGLCAAVLSPLAASNLGEGEPCARYAWPLDREAELLSRTDGAIGAHGGARWEQGVGHAFQLALSPGDTAEFILPPGRSPASEPWYGGAVELPAPSEGGTYQVTLSADAWIDVVQNGVLVPSSGFTGEADCPVRKSVRFGLDAAPFVVQISGAARPDIRVVVTPAVD